MIRNKKVVSIYVINKRAAATLYAQIQGKPLDELGRDAKTVKEWLVEVVKLDPAHVQAWSILTLDLSKNNPARAFLVVHGRNVSFFDCVRTILELDSKSGIAWFALGRAFLDDEVSGRVAFPGLSVSGCFKNAVELGWSTSDAWRELGDYLEKVNETVAIKARGAKKETVYDGRACLLKASVLDLESPGGQEDPIYWVEAARYLKGNETIVVAKDRFNNRQCVTKALEMARDPGCFLIWVSAGEVINDAYEVEVSLQKYSSEKCFKKALEYIRQETNLRRLVERRIEDRFSKEERHFVALAHIGLAQQLKVWDDPVVVSTGYRTTKRDLLENALHWAVEFPEDIAEVAITINPGKTLLFNKVEKSKQEILIYVLEELKFSAAEIWQSLAGTIPEKSSVDVHGQSYDALQCCVRAVKEGPHKAKAWLDLGRQLLKREEGSTVDTVKGVVTAKQCFVKAIEIDKELKAAWKSLAGVMGDEDAVALPSGPVTKVRCLQNAGVEVRRVDASSRSIDELVREIESGSRRPANSSSSRKVPSKPEVKKKTVHSNSSEKASAAKNSKAPPKPSAKVSAPPAISSKHGVLLNQQVDVNQEEQSVGRGGSPGQGDVQLLDSVSPDTVAAVRNVDSSQRLSSSLFGSSVDAALVKDVAIQAQRDELDGLLIRVRSAIETGTVTRMALENLLNGDSFIARRGRLPRNPYEAVGDVGPSAMQPPRESLITQSPILLRLRRAYEAGLEGEQAVFEALGGDEAVRWNVPKESVNNGSIFELLNCEGTTAAQMRQVTLRKQAALQSFSRLEDHRRFQGHTQFLLARLGELPLVESELSVKLLAEFCFRLGQLESNELQPLLESSLIREALVASVKRLLVSEDPFVRSKSLKIVGVANLEDVFIDVGQSVDSFLARLLSTENAVILANVSGASSTLGSLQLAIDRVSDERFVEIVKASLTKSNPDKIARLFELALREQKLLRALVSLEKSDPAFMHGIKNNIWAQMNAQFNSVVLSYNQRLINFLQSDSSRTMPSGFPPSYVETVGPVNFH